MQQFGSGRVDEERGVARPLAQQDAVLVQRALNLQQQSVPAQH